MPSHRRIHGLVPMLVLAALIFGPATVVLADQHQHGASADVTLRGEIVDLACYIGHGAKGPDHQKCAAKCAQMGQPLGLLTAEGKLYLLVADHIDPAPFRKAATFAGAQAEVTGEAAEKSGVSALTVHGIKK